MIFLLYFIWDFFGGNDAEAETPELWPPHAKSWLIGKDSDAGRDWGQEEKGTTEDEMAGWHHWLDGHKSEWTAGVGDGQRPGMLRFMGSQRVGDYWATELNFILYYNFSQLINIIDIRQNNKRGLKGTRKITNKSKFNRRKEIIKIKTEIESKSESRKRTSKPRCNRRKEIIKIETEIETKKPIEKISKTNSWFF